MQLYICVFLMSFISIPNKSGLPTNQTGQLDKLVGSLHNRLPLSPKPLHMTSVKNSPCLDLFCQVKGVQAVVRKSYKEERSWYSCQSGCCPG